MYNLQVTRCFYLPQSIGVQGSEDNVVGDAQFVSHQHGDWGKDRVQVPNRFFELILKRNKKSD